MSVATLAPLRSPPAPLRAKIVAALRGAIEVGELAPGERLVERDLCERLGISRTSLREALREVVAEKLVTQGASRGLFVTQTTREEARAAYSLRGVIQGHVAEAFVDGALEAERATFSRASDALLAAYQRGDPAQVLAAKRNFYAALCAGAKNPLALELIEQLCLRVASWRRQALGRAERNASSIAEIREITRWVEAGDPAHARSAMIDHVRSVKRWALS